MPINRVHEGSCPATTTTKLGRFLEVSIINELNYVPSNVIYLYDIYNSNSISIYTSYYELLNYNTGPQLFAWDPPGDAVFQRKAGGWVGWGGWGDTWNELTAT